MSWKGLLILYVPLLTSCGGGFTDSGFDIFPEIEICDLQEGTWEGPTTSSQGKGSGKIFIFIGQDKCDLSGTVTFLPCVPATPVEGSAGFSWTIRTTDDALEVRTDRFDFSGIPDVTDDKAASEDRERTATPVGTTWKAEYTFFNINNVPNCPKTDAGTAELTKTS